MGRIRTIKPEFPQSESVGRLSRDARLLFVQLWTFADDSGRARAASRLLASTLYPYDDDVPELIDGWLDELEAGGFIIRYEAEGNHYLQISNWLKHQKIEKPSQSKIPAFAEHSPTIPRNLPEPSTTDLGPRTIGPRTKDQGPSHARARASVSDFETFWRAYPRREGKGAARKAWERAITKAMPDAIIRALDRPWPPDPRYIPHAATWLNQERWTDEIDHTDPVLRAAGLENLDPEPSPSLRLVSP